MASRQYQKFSPVQITPITSCGDWTPEQAVDLLAQGYTVTQVVIRTGYDVRWLTAQERRLLRR